MDFEQLRRVTWYPGHMRKAEREVREKLAAVDLVIELVDARAPGTSHSTRLRDLTDGKPSVRVLGKSDLAEAAATRAWRHALQDAGEAVYSLHHRQREAVPKLIALLLSTARDDPRSKFGRLAYKRAMRAMVVGLPNVGKSTLINALVGGKRARTGPQPGVTRHQQWVPVGKELELLDTPGIMYPRIEDPADGLKLGLLAMLKQDVVSEELLSEYLLHLLHQQQRTDALARYDLPELPDTVHTMLAHIGERLGLRGPGGEIDTPQAANRLLHDFREGMLGRLTLENPTAPAD